MYAYYDFNASIVSVYQCLDGSLTVGQRFCSSKAGLGGCDVSSIGTFVGDNTITWLEQYWLYMLNQCKRACKLCLDNF